MITLFIGDVTDDIRYQAQATDPDAQLITQKNYKNLTSGTYYVSLGDFTSLRNFFDILVIRDKSGTFYFDLN